MKKVLGLLLSAVLGTGCVAHMMETHGDAIQIFHLPNEKPGKGGVIRYLNTGLTAWKNARRSNAEKQMEQFCHGPYTITAEGPRSKFGSKMPTESHITLEVDEYTYLAFECTKKR